MHRDIDVTMFMEQLVTLRDNLYRSPAYLLFVSRRAIEDKCLTVAGSLTFTTLLAIVPLFTVTITLTAKLAFTRDLILQLKAFVLKNFVPEMSSRVIGTYMDQFSNNASRLTAIGLCIVIVSAVALLFTIENSFNGIWRTRRKRAWGHRLRWAVVLLMVGPFLIATSLSISMFFVKLSRTFEATLPWLDDGLLRSIPWITTAIVLYLAYRWIPNRHVPARHAFVGAAIAAILFELMKALFVLYVSKVPTYSLVYGAFASIPIFLVWMFLCWLVVLVGAEIAATLSYFRHAEAQLAPADQEASAARLLAAMGASGAPLTLEQLRAAAPMPLDVAEDALHLLVERRMVEEVVGRPLRYVQTDRPTP
jgi:membrane protein